MHSDAIMCDMFVCPLESESGNDHPPLLQMTDRAYEQYRIHIKFFLNFRLVIVPFSLISCTRALRGETLIRSLWGGKKNMYARRKFFYGLFGYAILSLFIKKYKIITTMKKKYYLAKYWQRYKIIEAFFKIFHKMLKHKKEVDFLFLFFKYSE